MRKSLVLSLFLPLFLFARDKVDFDRYFLDRTLRIDYYHAGDKTNEWVTLDALYREGTWAGPTQCMIDPFNLGKYRIKVTDAESGRVIYTRGFASYFGEYQTTVPAREGIKRTYHETARVPFPRNKILFSIEARGRDNALKQVFEAPIDPADTALIADRKNDIAVEVIPVIRNGSPHSHVDLAFIAEGYTRAERDKAAADARHFAKVLLDHAPFSAHKDKFNIVCVFCPSQESGCDEPTHNRYRNTAVGATFNSLGSYRYLLTEDNKSLHDVARHVPYDNLLIMVNQARYGGGGIYNFYLTFTTGNEWRDYVFVHEFGHNFAGLADEYYSSATAYDEFYPKGIEPLEANITALLNSKSVKWGHLLDAETPVPTPWSKEKYDALGNAYQKKRSAFNKRIAQLERSKAPEETIKKAKDESHALSLKVKAQQDAIIKEGKYSGKVGVFEGGGYLSKGMYRPMTDCIMFSKGTKPFCKVCQAAIVAVIKYHCGSLEKREK